MIHSNLAPREVLYFIKLHEDALGRATTEHQTLLRLAFALIFSLLFILISLFLFLYLNS